MFQKYRMLKVYSLTTFLAPVCILLSSCAQVTEVNDETYSLIALISIVATGSFLGFLSVIIFYEAWRQFNQIRNKKKSEKLIPDNSDVESADPRSTSNEDVREEPDLYSGTNTLNNALNEIRSINTKINEIGKTLESTKILRTQKTEIEKELKQYVNGYNFSVLKLGITDLIDAYEYTSDAEKLLTDEDKGDLSKFSGYIKAISSYLQQGLEIAGIEQFMPEAGSSYQNSHGTEMVEKVTTDDTQKLGTIAKVIKPGWKTKLPDDITKQNILRKSTVSVYTPLDE